MTGAAIEICPVGPRHADQLARFFSVLEARGVDKFFSPHPFTADVARERAMHSGMDLYVVLLEGEDILGYGMLRGWDEGYDIPSLGVAIHPDAQDQGFGRLLMEFLRLTATRRGARKICLRVRPDNVAAVHLYRSLGYELTSDDEGAYLKGTLCLHRSE